MENDNRSSVRIIRTFAAPLEVVWMSWTRAEVLMKWFGSDPNGTVHHARLDVWPEGTFEVTFMDSDQKEHTCFGTYGVVAKYKKLSFSWQWRSEMGESEVKVQFNQFGLYTQIELEHSKLNVNSKHNYQVGWNGALNKLESLLTGEPVVRN